MKKCRYIFLSFSKTLQQDPFLTPTMNVLVSALTDFDKNHSGVKKSRSNGINSARSGQAEMFDANLCPILKKRFIDCPFCGYLHGN